MVYRDERVPNQQRRRAQCPQRAQPSRVLKCRPFHPPGLGRISSHAPATSAHPSTTELDAAEPLPPSASSPALPVSPAMAQPDAPARVPQRHAATALHSPASPARCIRPVSTRRALRRTHPAQGARRKSLQGGDIQGRLEPPPWCEWPRLRPVATCL